MSFIRNFLLSLSIVLLHGLTVAQTDVPTYSCQLVKTYQLEILGSSNTIDFTCVYNSPVDTSSIHFQLGNGFISPGPLILLRVDQLDCGSAGINYDMQKTLQSDAYPFIKVKAVETSLSFPLDGQGSVSGFVHAWINIAGIKKLEKIKIQVKQTGPNSYRLSGKHRLYFSNYNMEAPKAMFGLIKVSDALDLAFDIEIRLIPA